MLKLKPEIYKSTESVRCAPRQDIDYALLYSIVPKDQYNFLKVLLESCTPYAVRDVNVNQFLKTSVALTRLREHFTDRYLYLVKACNEFLPEAIPDVSIKGVLKVFLCLTPKALQTSFKVFLNFIQLKVL